MKKKSAFFYIMCAGFGASIFLLISLFYVRQEDTDNYLNLIQKTIVSKNKSSLFNVKQERIGVHKEIWLSKEGGRHEIHIESPFSEVTIEQQGSASYIAEKLKNTHLVMQDKLYYSLENPRQEIRRIFAENATFSYQDRLFTAENVTLSSFNCEGHVLPKSLAQDCLLMKGKASKVFFDLSASSFNFKAQDLKASFYTKENPDHL